MFTTFEIYTRKRNVAGFHFIYPTTFFPLPLTLHQFLTKLYFGECFDLTSVNVSHFTTIPELFSSVDTILVQQSYANLVSIDTCWTPSETRSTKEHKFRGLIGSYTDVGDPIISTNINLHLILFMTAADLTLEETTLPSVLHPKVDREVFFVRCQIMTA